MVLMCSNGKNCKEKCENKRSVKAMLKKVKE